MCYRDGQIFDHIIKIKKTYGLVQYIQRLLNMLYYLCLFNNSHLS